MKKNMKDLFIGFIIGGLVFGGMGVVAVSLTASEIKYTPSNEISTATNAEEAINELYEMTGELKKGELTLVGTTTSFNIADIVGSENVGKYSAEDFIVVPDFITMSYSHGVSDMTNVYITNIIHNISITKDFNLSYDNTNGNVNIRNMELTSNIQTTVRNVGNKSFPYSWSISPKVYLYL